jgi:AraC-like DNA-binding protein
MIRTVSVSTEGVSEREQFDFFRAAGWDDLMHVAAERPANARLGYSGTITARVGNSFACITRTADNVGLVRGARQIARNYFDGYWLSVEFAERRCFTQGGRDLISDPREIVLGDTEDAFTMRVTNRFHGSIWALPRMAVDRHLPKGGDRRMRTLSGSGIDVLIRDSLRSLTKNLELLDGPNGDAVIDTLCRLLAITYGAGAPDHAGALKAARLTRARQYIEQHLTDPGLTPGAAAAALGVSVRWLHKLFEPTGVSFAEHVQRRRLEECRAALAGPNAARRSVLDIAFGWGFTNLSTFYLAFQRQFGMAPGEFREQARRERN